MDITRLEDLVSLQRDLAARVQKEFRTPPMPRPAEPDLRADVAAKEAALAEAKAALQRVRDARDESVRRYDQEIQARAEVVARLEKQLMADSAELERVLRQPGAAGPAATG